MRNENFLTFLSVVGITVMIVGWFFDGFLQFLGIHAVLPWLCFTGGAMMYGLSLWGFKRWF